MHRLIRMGAVMLVSLLAAAAGAQETTGTILGSVKDPTGALIPNATITVLNTDKDVVIRTVESDATGEYVAPLLPIGHYKVTAGAPGFQKIAQTVVVNVNDKLRMNFSLPVGQAEEQVTVSISELQVELQNSTAAGLINDKQVRELSLNNRNYEQLVVLQPGVSYGGGDQLYVGVMNPNGDDNSVNFSINGARDNANNWTIDGADNVDRGSNSTLLNYPSVDSIAEFKVLRGMYDAEFGRGAGGQINVVTRSGDRTFHGSAYEFFRNDVLNANNYFNKHFANPADVIERTPLRYNNFGWTFGGPFFIPGKYNTERNKTFFFYSQEFRRVIMSATSNPGIVPTANEKLGIFANPVCIGFDSAGNCSQVLQPGTPLTNFAAIDAGAQAYIKDLFGKLPNPQDPIAHTLISPLGNVYNYRQEMIRVDHVFGPKLSVTGRWMNDSIPTEEPTGLWTGMNVPGVATTRTNAPGHNLLFRATVTFSPTLLLETGYAYSYGAIVSRNIGLGSTKNSPDILNAITLPSPDTLGRIPAIEFDGGDYFGGFGNYDDFNRNHNWFGNLTKVAGRHTLKFGGTANKYNKNENAGGNNTGTFTFGAAGLPAENTSEAAIFEQSWANFLLGNVRQFTQDANDLKADIHQNQYELYAQDEWRIRPNLTLSYGLRYSIFRQPTDGANRLTNFDPHLFDPAKAPVIDANGFIVPGANPNYDPLNGIILGGHNSPYGNSVAKQVNTNFAPRFGIAWDPFGKGTTSVRAGYGIFYDSSTVGYVEDNAWVNPPYSYGLIISNTRFTNPGAVQPEANTAPPYLRIAGVDWHTPYTQQWSLDVQREITKDLLIDVGYYGSKGTHLLGGIDLNQVRPGVALAAGLVPPEGVSEPMTLNAVRPYPGYSYMNAVEPWFGSNYHSLQASLQKRFSRGSLINVAYTFSKAMTDSPGDRWNAPQNTYDIRANYGPSPLDRKHILTASIVYELPWLRTQQGFVGHVLGGWEASSIVALNSGVPTTVTSAQYMDHLGLGFLASDWNSQLPDMLGNPNAGAPHKLGQWFNSSVFQDVPDGQYRVGNERRGAVRGPGFARWDMSLFKNIKLTERTNLQFRAEAFNVLNHTNFRDLGTELGGDNFGQVVSTRDPRNLQLGLKLLF